MKKQKRPTSNANDSAQEPNSAQRGLSKEAWVAIGTIAAALITGIVTLLVHVLPQAPLQAPQPTVSPTAATSPASLPSPKLSATADAIAGKWAGMARNEDGAAFQITLDIRTGCALKERCGVISVSHVPCYGEVFLETAQGSEFEFRVTNFYGQSDRTKCQSGAGEHFRLRPDGKLAYTTSYEPIAQGVLEKTGD